MVETAASQTCRFSASRAARFLSDLSQWPGASSEPLTEEWLDSINAQCGELLNGSVQGIEQELMQRARSVCRQFATLIQSHPDLARTPARRWEYAPDCELRDELNAVVSEFRRIAASPRPTVPNVSRLQDTLQELIFWRSALLGGQALQELQHTLKTRRRPQDVLDAAAHRRRKEDGSLPDDWNADAVLRQSGEELQGADEDIRNARAEVQCHLDAFWGAVAEVNAAIESLGDATASALCEHYDAGWLTRLARSIDTVIDPIRHSAPRNGYPADVAVVLTALRLKDTLSPYEDPRLTDLIRDLACLRFAPVSHARTASIVQTQASPVEDADEVESNTAVEQSVRSKAATEDPTSWETEVCDPRTPISPERGEFSFIIGGEDVVVRGFSETCRLEKSPGVERLARIVTSPGRRVPVRELVRIGNESSGTQHRDAEATAAAELTEHGWHDGKKRESPIGEDANSDVENAVSDLREKRDAAKEAGNAEEATRLTELINATLEKEKLPLSNDAKAVKNSLNRTYRRMRKDKNGIELAKHFSKYVDRRRKEPDFVYEPPDAEKIVWILK